MRNAFCLMVKRKESSLLCNPEAWEACWISTLQGDENVPNHRKQCSLLLGNDNYTNLTMNDPIHHHGLTVFSHTHALAKACKTCPPEIKKSNAIRYVHEKNVNDWARDGRLLLLYQDQSLLEILTTTHP